MVNSKFCDWRRRQLSSSVWNCSLGYRLKYSLIARLAAERSFVNFSRTNGSLGTGAIKAPRVTVGKSPYRLGLDTTEALPVEGIRQLAELLSGVVNGWWTPISQNSGQCCFRAAATTPARSFWFAARWAKKDRRTRGWQGGQFWRGSSGARNHWPPSRAQFHKHVPCHPARRARVSQVGQERARTSSERSCVSGVSIFPHVPSSFTPNWHVSAWSISLIPLKY